MLAWKASSIQVIRMSDWDLYLEYGVRLAVVLAAAYIVYGLLLRRKADFVIRVRGYRIHFKGEFPLSQRAALVQFLANDTAIHGPCKIYGASKKKRTTIWFSGHISEGEKQRVRNFLLVGQ
jgi:hypothetical protein